ncbi:MAG: hypothetical protein ACI8ZM_002764 [Crocinitomix sp.]|jgi:hypothetical protein
MEQKNTKKSSATRQILTTVAVAILIGSSAPWWWAEIFTSQKVVIDPIEEVSNIWKEGTLKIPVSRHNGGRVADLDSGMLLFLGTSVSAIGADIVVRQSIHSIVMEPGLSKGDGVSFDARFISVNDEKIGREGCVKALMLPEISNHLQFSKEIGIGSYIGMITTDGRLAEFNIVNTNWSADPAEIEISFMVWNKE